MEADDIKSYEYNESNHKQFNHNILGTINIHTNRKMGFIIVEKVVEGDFLKSDDARICNAFFSNIKYGIGVLDIENVSHPGIAGVIMGSANSLMNML